MDSINTLRAVLVAGAVVAAIGAFLTDELLAGWVLVVAVAAHAWMWWFLHQRRNGLSQAPGPTAEHPPTG